MLNFNIFIILILICTSFCYAQSKQENIQILDAKILFDKTKSICDADNGRLWGSNLYSPAIIVDKDSRFVVSNTKLPFSDTISNNGLYVGILPNEYIISNSTIDMDGTLFTIIAYYNDMDTIEMTEVLVHEMFHFLQEQKNWETGGYNNSHMDNKWGRIYLKLELLSLKKALSTTGIERKNGIIEALSFRNERNKLFPDKIVDELNFEKHEGLAVYTELKLCSSDFDKMKNKLVNKLDELMTKKSFVRSFGYETGCAYAFLNDDSSGWNNNIYTSEKSIIGLTKTIYDIKSLKELDSLFVNKSYKQIVNEEDSIQNRTNILKSEIEQKLKKQRLIIKREKMSEFAFDPDNVFHIEGLGIYYPFIEVSGDFGRIYSANGCLFTKEQIILFLDDSLALKTLELNLNDNLVIKNNDLEYYLEIEL